MRQVLLGFLLIPIIPLHRVIQQFVRPVALCS